MTVILSCGIHKQEMGSVHYCHELENHWGDILCYLPGILAEKLEIGWDCEHKSGWNEVGEPIGDSCKLDISDSGFCERSQLGNDGSQLCLACSNHLW
jgi:hypothetical protein